MTEENKDDCQRYTPEEFVKMAINHETGTEELWEFIDSVKDNKTIFDGKEWPEMFAITGEQRTAINEHVNALFNICRSGAIPCMFIMQETNMGGIGTYNVMNIIPRGRAGRKMMEVGNVVQTFIGDGTMESHNESLPYELSRMIANLCALIWKARKGEVSQDEFMDQTTSILAVITRRCAEIHSELGHKEEKPEEPSESDEKDL